MTFQGNYEKRYKDAQRRGETAEKSLAARTLSEENEALAKRYDDVLEDHYLVPELQEFRKERGVE